MWAYPIVSMDCDNSARCSGPSIFYLCRAWNFSNTCRCTDCTQQLIPQRFHNQMSDPSPFFFGLGQNCWTGPQRKIVCVSLNCGITNIPCATPQLPPPTSRVGVRVEGCINMFFTINPEGKAARSMLLHELAPGHIESPLRLVAAFEALCTVSKSISNSCHIEDRLITNEELALGHSPEFIEVVVYHCNH